MTFKVGESISMLKKAKNLSKIGGSKGINSNAKKGKKFGQNRR